MHCRSSSVLARDVAETGAERRMSITESEKQKQIYLLICLPLRGERGKSTPTPYTMSSFLAIEIVECVPNISKVRDETSISFTFLTWLSIKAFIPPIFSAPDIFTPFLQASIQTSPPLERPSQTMPFSAIRGCCCELVPPSVCGPYCCRQLRDALGQQSLPAEDRSSAAILH
ncbi:unnamed protein product [Rangifer tarandus platyrhynchus]|uniref:Uncharacterized protein n=1 Tax=Rangifer tarandus platyrhynchus TaxID=3082113 RepID=A0AC60A8R8_RANTA